MPTSLQPLVIRSPDAPLIDRVRAGDPDALGVLYDRHAGRLLRVAWRLLGERAAAEDVVHDLFVGLPEALRHYRDDGRLEAWLARCISRLALMHLRSHRRRREDPPPDDRYPSSDVSAPDRVELIALEAAIARLPIGLRAVFVLRHIEGFSHREIAATLGITEGNSRIRLTRALEQIQRQLHVPSSYSSR